MSDAFQACGLMRRLSAVSAPGHDGLLQGDQLRRLARGGDSGMGAVFSRPIAARGRLLGERPVYSRT